MFKIETFYKLGPKIVHIPIFGSDSLSKQSYGAQLGLIQKYS